MPKTMLHVMLAVIDGIARAEQALCALRRTGVGDVLLFCDLTDADTQRTTLDDPILRLLQSGVMATDVRSAHRAMLLVRRRTWDDAARCYLGAGQCETPRQVVCSLLRAGRTQAVFDAASFTPRSLMGQYDCALFVPDTLACTPDTPARMARRLTRATPCVRAQVLPACRDAYSPLERLILQDFSLGPIRTALHVRLARSAHALPDELPMLVSMTDSAAEQPAAMAADCFFVMQHAPNLSNITDAWQTDVRRLLAKDMRRLQGFDRFFLADALLPPIQLMLLILSALTGFAPLCFAALVLPESYALFHPHLLPGALLRTALLPMLALRALHELLGRAQAKSRLLRVHLPRGTPRACAVIGLLILPAAFLSVRALMPLLAALLLFMSAPLLCRAMILPTRERIMLTPPELHQFSVLAGQSLSDVLRDAPPARGMLCACAGCMLGLLEPDEAARQAEAFLLKLPEQPLAPCAHACMLACAQYLREHMGQCDAALRTLPERITQREMALPLEDDGGLLHALLLSARMRQTPHPPPAVHSGGEPADALFLPSVLTGGLPQHSVLLPLTHPHAFLAKRLTEHAEDDLLTDNAADRFLMLSAAALNNPFLPLLWRTPLAAPYAPMLAIVYRSC